MTEARPDNSMSLEVVTSPSAPVITARRGASGRAAAVVTNVAWVITIGSLVAGLLAPLLTDFDPTHAVPTDRLLGWGEEGHVLGTDEIGRDILTRLLYGARLAWIVGTSVAVLALVGGGVLGLLAGYLGGWVEATITRLVDAMLAFPPLLLALVASAVWGPSTRTAIFALGVVYTPLVARVTRAAVLGERRLDYVSASRGLGNSEVRTVFRHVVPNVVGPLLVVASVVFSRAVIVEASLSFLGAGTQAPNPNWGVMIAEGRKLFLTNPSLVLVPAAVLSGTLLAVNLVSDAIADRFDPGVTNARRQAKG
jgi:ABC-type dipeptide/oligopeptide/nickel transport system permease subunit